jgi:ADP-ribosylglycohydrolase
MITNMAIGDAYGAGFEFVKPQSQAEHGMVNDVTRYYRHPSLTIGNGRYTDDTQMALAIAELLVDGIEFTPPNIASKFVEVFKRDERPGYSGGFFNLLQVCYNGQELLDALHPGSTRSGAAMRVAPIGLLHSTAKIMELAEIQAKVTHDSPEGIASAQAIALATHYLSHRVGAKATVGSYVASFLGSDWATPWSGWVSVEGIPCAHAAITAVMSSDSQTEILKRCIDFGGDVDTIAAMAMFMASTSYEVQKDLDQNLFDTLEQGPYGLEYLQALDIRLLKFARAEGAVL